MPASSKKFPEALGICMVVAPLFPQGLLKGVIVSATMLLLETCTVGKLIGTLTKEKLSSHFCRMVGCNDMAPYLFPKSDFSRARAH